MEKPALRRRLGSEPVDRLSKDQQAGLQRALRRTVSLPATLSSAALLLPGTRQPAGGLTAPLWAAAPRPASLKATARLAAALLPALLLATTLHSPAALATPGDDLLRLLQRRSCQGCRLQDADLVRADLRDADLRQARLQRANLSQARLDGAQLQGADLRFTSLQGASLRGADLRGALLEGTDLRQSDLSGALLDPGALARSHWDQAIGVGAGQMGYAALHNAGVRAAEAGRFPEAEGFFGEAILLQPEAPVSWVGRALSRSEQGKTQLAAQDLNRAAALLEQGGDRLQAQQLRQAATALQQPESRPRSGNGMGGQVLSGAASMATLLAPLALKFLVPLAF